MALKRLSCLDLSQSCTRIDEQQPPGTWRRCSRTRVSPRESQGGTLFMTPTLNLLISPSDTLKLECVRSAHFRVNKRGASYAWRRTCTGTLTPCFLSSSFNGARLHFFPNMQLYHLQAEESTLSSCVAVHRRHNGASKRRVRATQHGGKRVTVEEKAVFKLSSGEREINTLCCAK